MIQRYDANGFPLPDVPTDGNFGVDFGREANYAKRGPVSAVADLEAIAAANNAAATSTDRTPASGKYIYDSKTGEYIWVPATAAAKAPVAGLAALQNQEQRGGGRDMSESGNPGWDSMSDSEKAAYYADNPTMAGITQALQDAWGYTSLGWLQNKLNPEFVENQRSIALGVTPNPTGTLASVPITNQVMDPQQRAEAGQMSRDFSNSLAAAQSQNAQNAVATGSNVTDPSQRGMAMSEARGGNENTGRSDTEGRGEPGNRGDWGRGGGYAKGGQLKGIGDLGGYSDGGRLLRGPGDGVSDSIPANIGGKRPARLADGEFVVPARIVSELGNGSTEAGARKLYAMLDRIQAGRKKSIGKKKVAVNSRADKNLPA
jgi:hypothetical protein